MAKFEVCLFCGAHLDNGERCDCQVEERLLTVSESFLNKQIEGCLQSLSSRYVQGKCDEVEILHMVGVFAGFWLAGLIDQDRYDELFDRAVAMSKIGSVLKRERK